MLINDGKVDAIAGSNYAFVIFDCILMKMIQRWSFNRIILILNDNINNIHNYYLLQPLVEVPL